MLSRDNVERNIDYLKNNDGTFHELYVAIIVNDIMNVPLDIVDDEKLNKISDMIDIDKIFDKNFKNKVMDIEKEIEQERILNKNNNSEISLWGEFIWLIYFKG